MKPEIKFEDSSNSKSLKSLKRKLASKSWFHNNYRVGFPTAPSQVSKKASNHSTKVIILDSSYQTGSTDEKPEDLTKT